MSHLTDAYLVDLYGAAEVAGDTDMLALIVELRARRAGDAAAVTAERERSARVCDAVAGALAADERAAIRARKPLEQVLALRAVRLLAAGLATQIRAVPT